MKNIQIVDRAANATFSIFQVTEEEFAAIFPCEGQDMEIVEDFIERVGEAAARMVLDPLWTRPVCKCDAQGIHGTLYYGYDEAAPHNLRQYLPASKREIDFEPSSINYHQRELFARIRASKSPAAS